MTTVHYPFDTRIFYKEALSLQNAGYNIVLVAPHNKNETVAGIRIISLKNIKNRFLRMLISPLAAYKKAKFENADIYHIHDPELLPAGRLLKRHGKTVIYDMHENLPKQILHKWWIKPYLRKCLALLASMSEKCLLSGIPVIFAEHSYKKDYLWINNYTTILNMPLKEWLNPSKKDDNFAGRITIGYMGKVSRIRGSEITIEALAALRHRGIEIKFECIGYAENTHKEKLLELCRKYSLHGITFHGHMPATKGWNIIGQCDICLALLHPIPNYIESYPTKLFEYMSLGIPVIASNFPLWREIIESNNCGICVNPLNPEEISEAIDKLASNPDLAAKMGRNGRRAVEERYNWRNEEKKLYEFYEKLLSVGN
jgi:glycosyltransferase involved in cell wall biosynthesis